jgi:hypothetical protein
MSEGNSPFYAISQTLEPHSFNGKYLVDVRVQLSVILSVELLMAYFFFKY